MNPLKNPVLYPFDFFFFNDTATTEIYTLSLHDALPIFICIPGDLPVQLGKKQFPSCYFKPDRKSTRLNSSHITISYAVFCLKKKKKKLSHSYTYNQQKNTKKNK